MLETWVVLLLHQIVFQGMFVLKNMNLQRKTGQQIRGKNIEATISIVFFSIFIGTALWLGFLEQPFGEIQLLSKYLAMAIGLGLIFLNLVVSGASLIDLKDSWRVGVIEEQQTELVTAGIYRFSRNPYFLSYLLMFAAYTVILQNVVLFGLSIVGVLFVHKMIMKEELYLYSVHGDAYLKYKQKVPRYIVI